MRRRPAKRLWKAGGSCRQSCEVDGVHDILDAGHSRRASISNSPAEGDLQRLVVAVTALATLWLATRPYYGVIHDAQFYVVQTLARIYPERFARDLFFEFGSQDQFTIFTWIYKPFVERLGLVDAHALLLLLGSVAWLAGALALASAILPDRRQRIWALAALVLLPPQYATGLLRYAEPFATPRLFVEAATLFALALFAREKTRSGALVLICAGSIHPLMAMPGIAFIVISRLTSNLRRSMASVGTMTLLLVLTAAMSGNFPSVSRPMDITWFDAAITRNPYLVLGRWQWWEILLLSAQLFMSLFVIVVLTGRLRHVALVSLIVGVAGLLATIIGGDIAKLQIIIAGQPWRALWITAMISNLLVVPALLQLRREGFGATGTGWPSIYIALGAALLTHLVPLSMFALAPALALAVIHVVLHRTRSVPRHHHAMAFNALLAVVAGWWLAVLVTALPATVELSWEMPWVAPRQLALSMCGIGLLYVSLHRPTAVPTARVIASVMAGLIFFCAVSTLDQRSPWQRFLESPGPEQTALMEFVPRDSNVFWDGGVGFLWFRLRRAAYFSCLQGAGTIFFRDTALAFRRRAETFGFQTLEGRCFESMSPRTLPPTGIELQNACLREPELDYLILPAQVENLAVKSWRIPVSRSVPSSPGQTQPAGEVFRYDCTTLRMMDDARLRANAVRNE